MKECSWTWKWANLQPPDSQLDAHLTEPYWSKFYALQVRHLRVISDHGYRFRNFTYDGQAQVQRNHIIPCCYHVYCRARPAILVAGKCRGGMFLVLLFLYFHSCSSFFPVPLFHLLYYLFYLFSPFLWETTQNTPQGLTYC